MNTAALLGVVRITGNAALGSPYTLTAMQHQIRGSTTEPSGDAVTATATRVAQQSTVKVTGQVGDTGRGSEGSGSSTATAWR
ncbi:hypothetical protein [Streptomyces spinoverrucosus]|uniref:hypothetical protein n=1 Tax=Streptomyces spinoverrucosus TaxID=284043 RepID=UPI00114451CF|nr:hypothetical protein [Streptomyces spinoverrucosus]